MGTEAHHDQFERTRYIPEQGSIPCTLALIAAVRSGEASPSKLRALEAGSGERAKTYGCVACMASLTDEGKPYIQGENWCDLPEPKLTQVKEAIAAHVSKPRA